LIEFISVAGTFIPPNRTETGS